MEQYKIVQVNVRMVEYVSMENANAEVDTQAHTANIKVILNNV